MLHRYTTIHHCHIYLHNTMWKYVFVLSLISGTIAFNLTILHTNDVHARYEETNKYSGSCSQKDKDQNKCYGGVARLFNKVNDLKSKYPNNLVLDAGDQFQGTIWFYQFAWNVTQYFMNYIGYDAMAIGNHEFDNKVSGLVPFLDSVNFPVLSSNIDASKEPSMNGKFNKSTILTVDGVKIAVIGYTTTDTPRISQTGNVAFNDEVDSVRTEVAAIKANDSSIKIFIALGHAGFTKDKRMAREVEDIDIVVGGHTDTFLYSGEAPSNEKPEGDYPFVVTKSNGKKALCVQDYAYGKYLGFLNVEFDDNGEILKWGGNPILLDSSTPQDNDTLELMKPWKTEVEKFKTNNVGHSKVFLEGDSKVCRRRECNLGNVITDSMLRYNLRDVSDKWNNVSIVLMNSGGIRSSIQQGNITFSDVLGVLPFRNTADILDLKGVHLKATLEHGVSKYHEDDLAGGFLQFSGLRVKYNVLKPVGERVVSVKVLCTECTVPVFEDLDMDKIYSIIIPNFVANGGDDYQVIVKNKMNYIKKGDLDSTIFNTYLQQFSPIIQGLDGRIEFVTDSTDVNGATSLFTCFTTLILCFMVSIS